MKCLSLRWRIILALIAVAMGTTLTLSLLAWYFLGQSLDMGIGIHAETDQALTDALTLAKQNYDRRKTDLTALGTELSASPLLAEAFHARDTARLQPALHRRGIKTTDLRFYSPQEALPEALAERTSGAFQVFKNPREQDLLHLIVPVRTGTRVEGALVLTDHLDRLLNIERAAQTYEHLQMIEDELYEGFLRWLLAATAGVTLLASLIGIRIGFQVTGPLYALIKGTRELARDNLDYRIPPGRDDEIGLVINSFNRMAEDLKENRRQRVQAEKVAAWQEIARRLAHEIKNPLTPIQLTVQQMRDKYAGADPAYHKLLNDCTEIVTEEVETLRSLVQEFADFARMPSLKLSRQDLNSVIRDIVRLYPDVRIHLNLDPELPELDLDAEKMRRVLINLVENSIEASGPGAPLEIQTGRLNPVAVALRVIDAGPGVPVEDRERIFQPYVSTKQNGMGLGLAVVRSIVEDHGGQITVAEAPGGGALFEIFLPVMEETARRPEVHA